MFTKPPRIVPLAAGRERAVEPRQEQHAAAPGAVAPSTASSVRERVVDAVVAELVGRVHDVLEHVLEHLAAEAVLRAHDVAVDERARHREDLVLEVGAEVGDRVDEHARRADREPGAARR